MPHELNSDYVRRIMQKDVLRGEEVLVVTGEQFGVATQHPTNDRERRQIGRSAFTIGAFNYRGWSVAGKLYCAKCWSALVGIPRAILQRNWCDNCNSRLYPADDGEWLDWIGYRLYRGHVARYTQVAAKGFPQLIAGSHNLWRNGVAAPGHDLDHIYSVRDGFENNVPEIEISAPPNIQVLPTRANIAKGRTSGLTLQELGERYAHFLSEHPEWLRLVRESDDKEETFVWPDWEPPKRAAKRRNRERGTQP